MTTSQVVAAVAGVVGCDSARVHFLGYLYVTPSGDFLAHWDGSQLHMRPVPRHQGMKRRDLPPELQALWDKLTQANAPTRRWNHLRNAWVVWQGMQWRDYPWGDHFPALLAMI